MLPPTSVVTGGYILAKKQTQKTSYGIAELYGERFLAISNKRRTELLDAGSTSECPSLLSFPQLAPKRKGRLSTKCGKKGGVCSIRNFKTIKNGQTFGPITTTCPIRFYENGLIFQVIGETLLGNKHAEIAKEIPFLKRRAGFANDDNNISEDVGRIDMVMVNVDGEQLDWCAVELQAVYFSGGAMSKDYPIIRKHSGNDIPMPGANRRPDFRSSGPKRLMPQLQIKVPTLRRWGKKMAVVVDRPFFDALGDMDRVNHVSNADIVWFIVSFKEEDDAIFSNLIVEEIRYTTLERAVEGLTSGTPTTLPEFEEKIRAKLPSST